MIKKIPPLNNISFVVEKNAMFMTTYIKDLIQSE
jgi:hypothetical protein